jgi:hypothetical protein
MGTQVSYAVSNIRGPLVCQLVLVHRDGSTETLGSWQVGEKGWGTPSNPNALISNALTATPRADIAHVQVQALENGKWENLVQLP